MLNKTVSSLMLVLLVICTLSAMYRVQPARADVDWWPMFHHDLSHTGTSTSTAPTTNNTLWIYKIGGAVRSSPAVAGGFVYVGSEDNSTYCLNAGTGSLVWSYKTGGSVDSSPTVVGGQVYVKSGDGKVYCLNAANGALVWSSATGGFAGFSPAVVGGLVYVGSGTLELGGSVSCLNAANGALVWSYKTGGYGGSSPAVVGGLVYVGYDDGKVYCLNAANGALVWSSATGGSVDSPAVVGGLVYVGSSTITIDFGRGSVSCLNAASGALVWRSAAGNGVYSSPAVVGGLVYVGSDDGNVYCLNAATGTQVWSYKTGGWVWSSPAVVNGVVYVGSQDGKIYAFGPPSSPPLTVSISPTSVTLDVGQSQLFTSSVTGGTAPYTYRWYLDGALISDATNSTWTFKPTSAGSHTVYLKVTDSASAVATSNIVPVTVNANALSPYCELLGITFTQDFNSMSYNVTAVEQDYQNNFGTSTKTGPAYLLCGLSNQGYMYEVGLSWDYGGTNAYDSVNGPYIPGFNAFYSVFDPDGNQVYPAGSGPLLVRLSVNQGDSVQLTLAISGGNVGMFVYDWSTGALSLESYSSYGATYFVGLPNSPLNSQYLFTGLMTEQWHTNPYSDMNMKEVVYSDMTSAKSSAWMWIQEIDSAGNFLINANTPSPVSFISNPTQLQPFSSNGATEYSNAYQFITGAHNFPLSISISPASVTLNVGQSQLFTSTVTGGTPPYTYQWYLNSAPFSGGTQSSWTFPPTSAGSYTVYLKVTDNVGGHATSNTAAVAVTGPVYYSGNYTSVQAAIDAAPSGATVVIAPGSYSESLTINKTLTIEGEKDPPILQKGGFSATGITLLPGASGSTVTGIETANWPTALLIDGASDCSIYGNVWGSILYSAIVLQGNNASNNSIFNNVFQDTPTPINITASASNNTIYGNIITSQTNVTLNIGANANSIYGNSISGSQILLNMMNSNANTLYHNNFMAQLTVLAPGKNTWDNGTVGNYWSDYTKKCPNASEIDSSGLWNIAYPIDINNKDRFPLVKPWPTVSGHCVAVTSVVPTKTVIGQGMNCSLTVTSADIGEYAESLNVSAYANNTAMSPPRLSDLDMSCSTVLTFAWNTTDLAYGNYMVSAYAQPVANQTEVSSNNFTLGMLKVTIPGDLNGDFKDNLTDLVFLVQAYRSKPGDNNWNPNADINGNGIVDLYDLYYLTLNYNLAATGKGANTTP